MTTATTEIKMAITIPKMNPIGKPAAAGSARASDAARRAEA